jgi:nitrous oxide reductase accessory protein NosL
MRKTFLLTIAATAALTTGCSGSADDAVAAPVTIT